MSHQIQAACLCNTGKKRTNNEDNFYFDGNYLEEDNNGLQIALTTETEATDGLLMAVFDGMGGENFGEMASYAAARDTQIAQSDPGEYHLSEKQYLTKLTLRINDAVVDAAKKMGTSRMGSTMVSLHFLNRKIYFTNLGDSRAYCLRGHELTQVSKDHVSMRPMPEGKKAPLTQHLGIDPNELLIEPYICQTEPKAGDCYLLCSDGLTDMVSDEEIRGILSSTADAAQCVSELVEKALDHGGRDNITVIVCRIKEQDDDSKRRPEENKQIGKRNASPASKKRWPAIAVIVAAICFACFFGVTKAIIPGNKYHAAVALMNTGKYEDAIAAFAEIISYRDSETRINECKYRKAMVLRNTGRYEDAIVIFAEISSFSDSAAQITECKYQQAVALMNEAQYEEALLAFEALGAYSDSEARITKCNNAILEQDYRAALSLLNEGKYGEAIEAFAAISGYKDADDKMTEAIDKKMAAAAREPFTRVGSIVSYGHYEQDNDTTNGMEPIEWIVLEYDSATERALLLSRYGLDTYRFDTSTYQSWDKSEIRAWLNSTFLNSAFTSVEYPGIVTTKVSTLGDNGNGDESDTNDKLWLLSQGEATTFFFKR